MQSMRSDTTRSPLMLHSLSRTGKSVKSPTAVKKNALIESAHDAQVKQHHKLKPLKANEFRKFTRTVDSKHVTCSVVSGQTMPTLKSQEGVCRASLDDHVLAEELHVPSHMHSEQKNAMLFNTARTTDLQQPVTGSFVPSVVPTHFEATTKKDQFRKMRDYHNNVIKHPSYAHQHAVTGSDAVKYLEHRLREV